MLIWSIWSVSAVEIWVAMVSNGHRNSNCISNNISTNMNTSITSINSMNRNSGIPRIGSSSPQKRYWLWENKRAFQISLHFKVRIFADWFENFIFLLWTFLCLGKFHSEIHSEIHSESPCTPFPIASRPVVIRPTICSSDTIGPPKRRPPFAVPQSLPTTSRAQVDATEFLSNFFRIGKSQCAHRILEHSTYPYDFRIGRF